MWDIAGKIGDKYGDKRDRREIMYYMAQDNGGYKVYSGQRLKVRVLVLDKEVAE